MSDNKKTHEICFENYSYTLFYNISTKIPYFDLLNEIHNVIYAETLELLMLYENGIYYTNLY